MPIDKIDKIYDAMVADGAAMPERDKFKKKMLASGAEGYKNRKAFYDAMVADGADMGGSYEAFADKIGLHAINKPKPIIEVGGLTPFSEEPTDKDIDTVTQVQDEQEKQRARYSIPIREVPEDFKVEGDFVSNPINVNGKQRTMGDVANDLYREYDNTYRKARTYETNGYGAAMNKAKGEFGLDEDTARQLAGGVHDLYMKNVASDIAEELYRRMDKSGDPLYNAQKAFYDKDFLNSFYDHVASFGYKDAGVFIDKAFKPAFAKMLETKFNGKKVNADVLPTTLEGIRDKQKFFESQKTVEEGLNNKLGALEKYEKALNEDIIKRSDDITKQRIEEERKKSWWQRMFDAFARNEGMNTNSPEIEQKLSDLRGETSKLQAIHYAIKDARNTQKAANMFKRGNSFLSQIGKGALDRFTDVRAWDFGLTDMGNNMATLAAVKNYEKGKASSTDEKLLEAIAIGNSLRSHNQDAMSNYDVGSGAVDSAFYGLTFIATPYNGLGGKLAQQFEKYAFKRFGAEAIKSGVLGKMALAIGKKSSRMAGDLVFRPIITTAMYGSAHIAADASNRQAGNIGFNDNGSVEINGKESNALTALAKATGALYIENMSEGVSDFIPGSRIIGKSIQKGIGKTFGKKAYKTLQNWGEAFTDAWTKVGTNEISTVLEQARKRAKLGDLTGEYIEEIVGGIGNALVIGDQTLDAQEGTGVFNTDNMWQTLKAISVPVGTMNAVQYGAHKVFDVPNHFGEAARYEAKERMLRKQVRAQAILGDKWQSIKDIVDGTDGSDDSDFGAKMSEATRRLNPEAKKAVVDYVVARGYYNGANMQSLKENLEGLSGELAEAYKDGTSLVDKTEMCRAKIMYDESEKRLHDILGVKYSEELPSDEELKGMLSDTDDNTEIADRIQSYEYAKAQYYGMIERVQTNLDMIEETATAEAEAKAHKQTNQIIPATMKLNDRSVYIVDGDIVKNDDGTINKEKSSDSIMIKDAESGKAEMVSPSAILSVEQPVELQQVIDDAISEQKQAYAAQEADKIDGKLDFMPNDQFYIFDNDKQQHEVLVVDRVMDEDTQQIVEDKVIVSIDGARPTIMSKEELQDMHLADVANDVNNSLSEANEQVDTDADTADTTTEEPIEDVNTATTETDTTTEEPTEATEEEQTIPTDENGQPIYEQAEPTTAWNAIVEQCDGDVEIAQTVANDMVADMEAALKKAEKAKPKGGATVAEKIASEKERKAVIEQAKANLEHWKRIAAVNFNRQAAVQVEQQRKDEEAAESANQRGVEGKQGAADGGRSTNVGGPSERQSDLGKTEEVKLSDEIDENGRQFVLTSEGELAFGEIGEGTGLTAAPILLSEGMITNAATNDGYGLVHIEARHGDQIRNAGYKSVVDFIETVAKNYDVIKEGNLRDERRTYRLQLTDKHNNTLMVELSGDGTYWNINTAGIFKTSYGKKNKEVYNRHTTVKQPVEAAETSQDAEQGDTQTSSSMNVPTSSESKVINNQSDLQENGEKSSEKEGVTPLSEQIAAQEAEARKAEQEEAERQKREALNGVPNVTEDTASDARARGQSEEDDGAKDHQGGIDGDTGEAPDVPSAGGDGVRQAHEEVGLSDDEATAFLSKMEDAAEEMPQLELTPENWHKQFGEDGVLTTPIGQVKMGANQIAKLFEKGRSNQFGMIKPTLENPNVIIEVPSSSIDGTEERYSSYLFVKTFTGSDGCKIYYFKSVTVKKDGMEVSVSSHYDRPKRILDALKKGKLLYRFDGGAQTEHRPADVSVTTSPVVQGKQRSTTFTDANRENTTPISDLSETSSEDKGNNSSSNSQGKAKEVAENHEEKAKEEPKHLVSDARMEELKRRLREKLRGQLNMGIDPELLAIGTEIAVGYIERGVTKFGEYAKAMIADLGDTIRPYLKALYNGARDMPEMVELSKDMTPYNEVSSFNVATIGKEGEDANPSILDTAEQISNEATVESNVQQDAKNMVETEDVDNDTYSITKQHNNKKDIDIWVVRGKERTDKDVYMQRKQVAKEHNGYYSSFRGVNGFVFNSPEDAQAFADKVFNTENNGNYAQKSEEIMRTDNQGNPIDEDGNLIVEKIASISDLTDEDFEHPTRSVELPAIPQNVDDAIGANGKPVVIKKNIFEKNKQSHSDLTPVQSREILHSALYNADLYGRNQKAKRPYNWVVINTTDEKGHNRLVLLEVNNNKDNVEIVHWHYIDERGFGKIKKQAEREGGQLLILPSDISEEAGALSSRTPDLYSGGKDTQSPDKKQEKEEENDKVNLSELKDFAVRTGSGRRTTVDEAAFDSEDLTVPLLVDGKSSRLSVATIVPDVITDSSYQTAVYDYSEEIDEKTNSGWQKWEDLSEEYNSQASDEERASIFGDSAELHFSTVDAAVKFNDWIEGRRAERQVSDATLRNDTEAKQLATNAVLDALDNAGISVEVVSDEVASEMLGENDAKGESSNEDDLGIGDHVQFMRTGGKKKSASETASPDSQDHHTVVSSADGAKVQNDLDNLVKEYENSKGNKPNTFIGDVSKALGAKRQGSASEYASFETKSGKIVTIRLSNHNAKISTFDTHNEADGISIVVTPKENNGIANDGNAHVTEFYYNAIKLRRADGKPLVEILKSIKQSLYSGEYNDTTGLAEVQEVNVPTGSNGQTEGSTVYGWTVGGKIFLTKDGINPNTPIHEYTHLWACAMRQHNAKGWQSVKGLLKGTPIWNEVLGDPNYRDISADEDAVASEALSRISGTENARKMEAKAQRMIEEADGIGEKAEAVSLLDRMRRALDAFWRWAGKNLFKIKKFESIEEVTDRVLYDLTTGTDLDSDRSLMAVHNISVDKLESAFELGGFPMPSIAITNANMGHSGYGDISLVFAKESIDPSYSRNKVYSGDAWTPMFPQIGYKLNDKKTNEIYKRANDVGRLPLFNPVYFYPDNYERKIDGRGDASLVDSFKEDYDAKQMYLAEKGNAVRAFVQHEVQKYSPEKVSLYKKILETIGLERLKNDSLDSVKDDLTALGVNGKSPKYYERIILCAIDYAEHGNSKIENDINATEQEIDKRIDGKSFSAWLKQLFDGVVEKKGIRNERDMFTPSGSSRKWESLYDAVTLDNVIKNMRGQAEKGGSGIFNSSIFGASTKELPSIDAIRREAKLRFNSISNEKMEKAKGRIIDRLEKVSIPSVEKGVSDAFDFVENVINAVSKSHSPSGIYKYLHTYYPDMTMEAAKEISDIVSDIQKMSTRYFEAKPYRAVGFDEVRAAVVPNDVPKEIIDGLRKRGIKVVSYEKGNDQERKDALSSVTREMDIRFQIKGRGKSFDGDVPESTRNGGPTEEELIVERAKADGSYMKAPNGQPTKLTAKQWVQVRTKAFKEWFGDWERSARIEKLKNAESVEITGDEYKGKYELNRASAKNWIKDNLRGEYTITDTGEKVFIGRKGVNKVTSHSIGNDAHLKILVAVPSMLEKAIFITEEKAEKRNAQYPLYRYYVAGVNIGGIDYTVKLTIGVDENGNKYYDHALTEIEKGKLLDQLNDQAAVNGFISTGAKPNPSVTIGKDTKLLSILQTNSSKVLDENGEPKVLYHGTPNDFTTFDIDHLGETSGDRGLFGAGFYFNDVASYVEMFAHAKGGKGRVIATFLNLRNPYIVNNHTYEELLNHLGDGLDKGLVEGMRAMSKIAQVKVLVEGREKIFTDRLIKNGFDGVIAESAYEPLEIVAFSANQIKSATENNGDFSKENDDILFRHDDSSMRSVASENDDKLAATTLQASTEIPVTNIAQSDAHSNLSDAEKDSEELMRDGDGAYSDDELSIINDPVAKILGRSTRSKRQREEFAKRERRNMAERVSELAKTLNLDNVEVITDTSGLQGRKAEAKGFYSKSNGKITVVVPNHIDIEDVEKTLLHEAVAHYGLRKLFGEHFETFLDNIYQHADEEIRKEIVKLAANNGWDFRTATEEYLAGLAENTNFENADYSFFTKIKELFLKMLNGIGFKNWRGGELSDNELRYLLWRSYENLKEPGHYRSILGEAADVAKQYELGVGNYAESESGSSLAAETSYGIEEVNERFNAELQMQIEGTLPNGHVYDLGMPSDVLLSTGFPNVPIELSATHLATKATAAHHPFGIEEMKDLAKFIQKPMAVFSYGDKNKSQNMIVEIQHDGKNFVVGIHFNQQRHGAVVNDIRGLYPKDNAEWLNWITQGKLLYADKERIQTLIDQQRRTLAEVDYLDLNSIAKIVKDFDNPKVSDEYLFRDGDKVSARDIYEQRVSTSSYQAREALQDSMLGLKTAMDAVLKSEGVKKNIEDVEGWENAYLGGNRLSSVSKDEADRFARELFAPMLEEVTKLCKDKSEKSTLYDYMMAKHGLERNELMAQREGEKNYQNYIRKEHNGTKTEEKFIEEARNRDYAGLTAVTDTDNVADATDAAKEMVDKYEQKNNTENLWKKVNAVTTATLAKSYECGIINKETFDKISGMYKYYIPLRGFDEKTSSDAYAYITHPDSAFNAPVKTANGRTSKADDPIANMQSMAESIIAQGNRNKLVKQKFLNFVLNHPSDLFSVNELWLEYNEDKEEWLPVFADNINDTDTPEEVNRKIEEFEEKMSKLAEKNPLKYKRGREAANIPYRVVNKKDEREHQIIVKRNGIDYVITVNGNPRAAQAVNGATNPDNNNAGLVGKFSQLGEKINRELSAFYTTRNPDFIISNFLRDMTYSNTMVWVKESPNYALRFNKNIAKCNPFEMKRLLARYRKGTLDMDDKTDNAFYHFMRNGGETGYANMRDIDKHKNDIRKELRRMNARFGIEKNVMLLAEQFDEVSRAIENSARFAAFLTSREFGRTIDRSIYDAKEISVNFNKKGAGSKFFGAKGQTRIGNIAAGISGAGRSLYVFWNAAIQGTTNFGRQAKRHPAKAFTMAATMFLLGATMASIGIANGDDDDDKNNYWNLPEYVRRSNITFKIGNQWTTIPLPVEYRALYGLGELMISSMSGKEHFTTKELAKQIAGLASQVLPLDIMQDGGSLTALVPSAFKPMAEVGVNKSWTGAPIYKDTEYNKKDPEWTKAYKSANTAIVEATKFLNQETGGNTHKSGHIDFNPAVIEYLLNGYFSGVSNTVDRLSKMAEWAVGKREYSPRDFIFINRLSKKGDERTEARAVNNEYYRLKEEHDEVKKLLKAYEDDTYNGIFDYAEELHLLNNSEEFARSEIFDMYADEIKTLEREYKEAETDEERKEIERVTIETKKMLIDDVNAIRK